jgi:hypothetical protein
LDAEKPEMDRAEMGRFVMRRSVSYAAMMPCFETEATRRLNKRSKTMTLEQSRKLINGCAEQMNSRYNGVVFDEWAVVSLAHKQSRILNYAGPRNDDFLKNFANDLGTLRTELLNSKHGVGDFEFSRHGVGTLHEAFMVVAEGVYLICNNTRNSMDGITKDARWIEAQVPFVELSEKFRANPLVCSW